MSQLSGDVIVTGQWSIQAKNEVIRKLSTQVQRTNVVDRVTRVFGTFGVSMRLKKGANRENWMGGGHDGRIFVRTWIVCQPE